ncbi:MAG: diguanylate cyclase [Planctomycetes bacterium]|nr:diguanylate cyclase [Planctomycetota bacterium]
MSNKFDELKLTGNLPSPSGVGMAILRLTQSDDFSAEELARTIQSDPALTGRIVKMSNSAQSAGVKTISTVSDAVVRLGVRAVRNVALGFSLVSAFRKGKCEAFDYGKYWSDSLARAVAAQTLSRELRLIVPSEAYICALLSGIGRLALASVHPRAYSELLRRVAGLSEVDLAAGEREVFEIDHFEVAEAMLKDWRLPDSHALAVASYARPVHETVSLDKTAARLCTVLRVATPIARILLAENDAHHFHWPAFESALKLIDIDRARLCAACDGIAAEWRDWGKVLSVPTQSAPPFAEIAQRASESPTAGAQPAAAVLVNDIDPTAAPQEAEEEALAKLTVLAVDDDPISLKLLVTHLARQGYEVMQAANGTQALAMALERNPHIVVSDWMMPGMDGIELTRSLRKIEIGRDMYILLLTGREEEEQVVEAFDAGVDDFVSKPFNPRILLSRVAAGERLVRLQVRVAGDKAKMEQQVAQLAVLNRKLTTTTVTDALTSLPNRRHAMQTLEQAFERRDPGKADQLSLIMIDIDHFKKVNDEYGHDAGDAVLCELANVLRGLLRRQDTVCRLGGEEFIVVCPGSDAAGAAAVAERLRKGVASHRIRHGRFDRSVTCSFGVAQRTPLMQSHEALLKAADVAVYEAKEAGRNRVCVAPLA